MLPLKLRQNKTARFIALSSAILIVPVASCSTFAMSFANSEAIPLQMRGKLKQSHAIIGKTAPNAKIKIGEIEFKADNDGNFVFGFDRDEKSPLKLEINDGIRSFSKELIIETRKYKVTNVNGLPPSKVNPPPEAVAKLEKDRLIKNAAWASLDENAKGFMENFKWPLKSVRITSSWGAVRSLNGTPGRPHYGVDLGAPTGTNIYAPASGKIVIAENNLYYEGGLVGIDHGQGFISYTMHMSSVDVKVGQLVVQGDKIGKVGSTGRSTGPHLHWSLRWHDKQIDPATMIGEQKPIIFGD
jgi:murein DD-endopeptidase MepM/ murein hydrolase activator NlpD